MSKKVFWQWLSWWLKGRSGDRNCKGPWFKFKCSWFFSFSVRNSELLRGTEWKFSSVPHIKKNWKECPYRVIMSWADLVDLKTSYCCFQGLPWWPTCCWSWVDQHLVSAKLEPQLADLPHLHHQHDHVCLLPLLCLIARDLPHQDVCLYGSTSHCWCCKLWKQIPWATPCTYRTK